MQGKIAPVEAARLVKQSNLCVVVKPERGTARVAVTRVVWGSGLRVGDRISLKGYVFRDYIGGPNEKKESDVMAYHVDEPSLVFLRPPPKSVLLRSDERFALLPMVAFRRSHHDCRASVAVEEGRLEKVLAVGGVLFRPSMKQANRNSVSLDEVIGEVNRTRAGLSHRPD
jgi:hypothetical protein